MICGKNIICISSIDWDFIWQTHQEIMSTLAKSGNRVLFIENTGVRSPVLSDARRLWKRFLNWKKGFKGIRKIGENLYVYSPLILPFPYSKIAVSINKFLMLSVIERWMDIMEFHDPVVWTFLPTPITLSILDPLGPGIVIYHCVDDLTSSSKGARRVEKAEVEVIKRANLIFTTSRKLYHRCASLNKETHLFPSGVNIETFKKIREREIDIPHDMRGITGPIIGYIGGLHKWVDIELVKKMALSRQDISFVLIGPKQTDLQGIGKLDNVHILGEKDGNDLPKYVRFFDAGMIPYKITSYTEHVYPAKINEYLAMGKPVISTRIPEIVWFDRENGGNFIHFIGNEKDLSSIIDVALKEKDIKLMEQRIAVSNTNSWVSRIEKMCGLIDDKLKILQLEISRDWLGRFKLFYVRVRNRIVIAVGAIALSAFIIFYSPIIWQIAEPLRISQDPQKSDAIVVFGGGVGEGGSPGKSTVERAAFSADLYNEGFSGRIIYSSGYTWRYNDAENMKLIATSMGVPENSIILDKKGDMTYRNVKFTTEILRKNNFNKIILVSSPYNMRRASLVYRKIASDINVIYVPVSRPHFFDRHTRTPIAIDQWKAIIHEYLGIIYYKLKGYI